MVNIKALNTAKQILSYYNANLSYSNNYFLILSTNLWNTCKQELWDIRQWSIYAKMLYLETFPFLV